MSIHSSVALLLFLFIAPSDRIAVCVRATHTRVLFLHYYLRTEISRSLSSILPFIWFSTECINYQKVIYFYVFRCSCSHSSSLTCRSPQHEWAISMRTRSHADSIANRPNYNNSNNKTGRNSSSNHKKENRRPSLPLDNMHVSHSHNHDDNKSRRSANAAAWGTGKKKEQNCERTKDVQYC